MGLAEMAVSTAWTGDQIAHWQAVMECAGEGMWGLDVEGRCTFVNPVALKIFGFESEEMVGRDLHELVHHHSEGGEPLPKSKCKVLNAMLQNCAVSKELETMFRKDGSPFVGEISATPVTVEGEVVGVVVALRDLTERHQQEEVLRRSERLAAMGRLASSIAHEINNPLEAVTNLVYLIGVAECLEDAQHYAKLAQGELARVAEITLQTLRFSRQQSRPTQIDLAELLRTVMALYAGRMAARSIEAEVQVIGGAPKICALEGELRQVVNNLVRNALDAMEDGQKLMLRVHPERDRHSDDAGVRLTVADMGEGIHPEIEAHLFEPFHTTKESSGTGLGLWVTKGIVDKHGGRIRARTRRGGDAHGTVFTVWLPVEGGPNLMARAS